MKAKDARARAGAAFMLAMLPRHPDDLSSRLRKVIKKEKNEHAKASFLLALGAADHRTKSVDNLELLGISLPPCSFG